MQRETFGELIATLAFLGPIMWMMFLAIIGG